MTRAPAPVVAEAAADDLETRRQRYHVDLDRYVIEVLAPKAKACWQPLRAEGKKLLFRYDMRHDTGRGRGRVRPELDDQGEPSVAVVESDLSPEDTAFALDCMVAAVAGTSFETVMPRNDGDTEAVLFQAWQLGAPSDDGE